MSAQVIHLTRCQDCGALIVDDPIAVWCDRCADLDHVACSTCGRDFPARQIHAGHCEECNDLYQAECVRVDDKASEALWREDNPERSDLW